MAKPRNNICKLPPEVRTVICEALDNGFTYDQIRNMPEVAAACGELNLALHNKSFLTYSQGDEYSEYRQHVRNYAAELERLKMAAFLVDQDDSCDTLAKVAMFDLLRLVQGKLADPAAELDSKELASVSGALAAYERNRQAARKTKQELAFKAREAELEAQIKALETRIAKLNEKQVADPGKVADELRNLLGVKA